MRERRGALICVLLSLVGLWIAGYMAFLHLALQRGEILGGAACGAAGSVFNCHAVTASAFGTLLGMPLALWGVIGYLTAGALAVIAWQLSAWRAQALSALALLSGAFVAADAVLLIIMLTQIRYLCPLCLATYVVNITLVVTAVTTLGQRWGAVVRQAFSAAGAFAPGARTPVALGFWSVVIVGAAGTIAVQLATSYVLEGPPGALRKQMVDYVQHQQRVIVDTTGDPVEGDPSRPVRIVEFSDFLCPSCQKASKFTPIILASHRQDVSFVFKQFPLDMSCNDTVQRTLHPTACQVAAATTCAHEQGKFWALHDRIFEEGPKYDAANLERDAAAVGVEMTAFRECITSGRGMEAVKRDIAEAVRLNVRSTPTYVVNGIVISGVLPPGVFDELLRASR